MTMENLQVNQMEQNKKPCFKCLTRNLPGGKMSGLCSLCSECEAKYNKQEKQERE